VTDRGEEGSEALGDDEIEQASEGGGPSGREGDDR
jgi:hypothetical protein